MRGIQLTEGDIAIGREQWNVLVDWLIELWRWKNVTEAEKAIVADLNQRLRSKCACQCDVDGNVDINEMCLDHCMIVNDAMKAEREACAKIAEAAYSLDVDVPIRIAARIRERNEQGQNPRNPVP